MTFDPRLQKQVEQHPYPLLFVTPISCGAESRVPQKVWGFGLAARAALVKLADKIRIRSIPMNFRERGVSIFAPL